MKEGVAGRRRKTKSCEQSVFCFANSADINETWRKKKQQKMNGSGTTHHMGMKGNKRKEEPRSSWALQGELDAIMWLNMKEGVAGRRRKTKYMRSVCVLFCKHRGH